MKTALLQLNASDDPVANLPQTLAYLREAVAGLVKVVVSAHVCVAACMRISCAGRLTTILLSPGLLLAHIQRQSQQFAGA